MPHLSIRITDEEAGLVRALLEQRGLGARAKSTLVRALICEEHARVADDPNAGKPPVADERELHELATSSARGGNVAAMHELRMILRTPRGDAGGRGVEPKPDTTAFDELDNRRKAKSKRGS